LLRKSIVDIGQRATPAAGLSIHIQDVCQRGSVNKSTYIQWLVNFAMH
jgi:hypothetical protein